MTPLVLLRDRHAGALMNTKAPQRIPPRGFELSARGGIRTHDLRLRRPTLYPTELRAQKGFLIVTGAGEGIK